MTTQAKKVLAKTFEACAFKGDTMKGTIADGGAIFIVAERMFPDAVWNSVFQQIDFADGSAIEYNNDFSSLFDVTYTAV